MTGKARTTNPVAATVQAATSTIPAAVQAITSPTAGAPVTTTPTPTTDPADRWTAEDPGRRTRVRLRGAALGRVEVVAEDPEGAILAGLDRSTVIALVDAARTWLLEDARARDAAELAGTVQDSTTTGGQQ